MNMLKKWNCLNNIYSMVFNAKSCNIGYLSGACMTFQKCLCFLEVCRHHILELLLDKVFCYLAIQKIKDPLCGIIIKV